MDILQRSYILTGPTCSGKTRLAIDFAKKVNGQILCMDSMTLYRNMDIGTAKPSVSEQLQVKHHLLDILNPNETSNVAHWLKTAKAAAENILQKGCTPVFVGGTPMYLKALVYGLFDIPPIPGEIRESLAQKYSQSTALDAHQFLATVDTESSLKIHPNDLRRILRALEVYLATGKSISELQKQWKQDTMACNSIPPGRCLHVTLPREILYNRIHKRTRKLLDQGWIQETQKLMREFPDMGREAQQAIGYKEIMAFLKGEGGESNLEEQINLRTRHLAKKQETWFRHLDFCNPWNPATENSLWGINISKELVTE